MLRTATKNIAEISGCGDQNRQAVIFISSHMLTGFDDAIQGPYLAIVICMDQYHRRARLTLQTSHRETAISFPEIAAITGNR
jgi:hypothetical protein